MNIIGAEVTIATRPNLVVCAGHDSGVEPIWHALSAHPDIGTVGPDDFDDVLGDAAAFPIVKEIEPVYTSATDCADAFDAIARRTAGRHRYIAWKPGYALEWPHVLTITSEHLPEACLLFCLADPVTATYNRYMMQRDELPGSLDAAVDASIERMEEFSRFENRGNWNKSITASNALDLLLQSGVYYPTVRRALKRAPQQVFVVPFERLPEKLTEVAAYLDLDPEPLLDAFKPADSQWDDLAIKTKERLAQWFDPWNQRLFELLDWPADTWIRPT